jgi:hypothetical protein
MKNCIVIVNLFARVIGFTSYLTDGRFYFKTHANALKQSGNSVYSTAMAHGEVVCNGPVSYIHLLVSPSNLQTGNFTSFRLPRKRSFQYIK